jgi:hypothetical protein
MNVPQTMDSAGYARDIMNESLSQTCTTLKNVPACAASKTQLNASPHLRALAHLLHVLVSKPWPAWPSSYSSSCRLIIACPRPLLFIPSVHAGFPSFHAIFRPSTGSASLSSVTIVTISTTKQYGLAFRQKWDSFFRLHSVQKGSGNHT